MNKIPAITGYYRSDGKPDPDCPTDNNRHVPVIPPTADPVPSKGFCTYSAVGGQCCLSHGDDGGAALGVHSDTVP